MELISDMLIEALNELSLGVGSTVDQCVVYIQREHPEITTEYIKIVIQQEIANHTLIQPLGKEGPISIASVVEPLLRAANYRTFQSTQTIINNIIKGIRYSSTVPSQYYYSLYEESINFAVKIGYLLSDNKGWVKLSPSILFGYYSS